MVILIPMETTKDFSSVLVVEKAIVLDLLCLQLVSVHIHMTGLIILAELIIHIKKLNKILSIGWHSLRMRLAIHEEDGDTGIIMVFLLTTLFQVIAFLDLIMQKSLAVQFHSS